MDGTRLNRPLRTVVIGSGNVASALAPALEKCGAAEIEAVYSPTPGHAAELASKLAGARAITEAEDVPADAELYLLAVKDDAIAGLAACLKPTPDALWVHTSGGVEACELSRLSGRYGVFYPLQTFTKGVEVKMDELPIFIEASTEADRGLLAGIARRITPKVHFADGPTRCRMHAAAVFACNFTNHLWAMADDILRREAGTDLSVLAPLLQETMRKALSVRPADAQTGPAMRGDRGIIAKHASLLTDDEGRLYNILSEHILNYYNR